VEVGDLIGAGGKIEIPAGPTKGDVRRISEDKISEVFGIEMDTDGAPLSSVHVGGPVDAAPAADLEPSRKGRKPRRKAARGKPGRAAKPTRGKSAGRRTEKPASSDAGKPWTGKAVARLRGNLRVTEASFAKLAKVSEATVRSWERSGGPLNLRNSALDSLEALRRVAQSLR